MALTHKNFLSAAVLGAASVGLLAHSALAETVIFDPGTYNLAESYLGSPVDTLSISIVGGIADFVLTGQDTATFSVTNDSTPAGGGSNPYFTTFTGSWDTTAYPYLTFWSTGSLGGVTAGSVAGDSGANFFNLFQSTSGTGQVFTLSGVPEPATWAMLLVGFAALGFAGLRSRRKDAVAA
jgi:hypothetical protein